MSQHFVEFDLPAGMNGFAYFRQQALTKWYWVQHALRLADEIDERP